MDPIADIAAADPGQLSQELVARGLARDDRGGLFIPGLSFKVPDLLSEDGTPHMSLVGVHGTSALRS